MWWPLTLTYIFEIIRPWLWKLCPLCNVLSSRLIISDKWSLPLEGVLRVNDKILKFQFLANFSNLLAFTLFWIGIRYELVNSMDLGFKMNWSIVWVIMGRRRYPQNAGILVVLVMTIFYMPASWYSSIFLTNLVRYTINCQYIIVQYDIILPTAQ